MTMFVTKLVQKSTQLKKLLSLLKQYKVQVSFTTRPDTDLYSKRNFILMCFGNRVKTEEIQFRCFPGKSDLKKFLYNQLPDMMIHTHAIFAPLDFINKKMRGKRRVFDPKLINPFLQFFSLKTTFSLKKKKFG